MMKDDMRKYRQAEKFKKWREETQPLPWYYDGLERITDRIHPGKQTLVITDIEDLSYDTKLFRFVSAKQNKPLAPFRAGQYIGIIVKIDGVHTSRPFSLVSSPNQLAYYELGIRKKEDGFVSLHIYNNAKVGDIIEATEPMGNLFYNKLFHGKDLVFITGGCGITPFISMLRDISERMLQLNVTLILGSVSQKDILFREELERIQAKRSNIKVKFILSEPSPEWIGSCGFISRERIIDEIGSIENKYFYIVGNKAMYQFIKSELKALKIALHKAKYEVFGVPDDITKTIGWPTEIDPSKKVQIRMEYLKDGKKEKISFEASCVEPLLNSIERQIELRIIIETGCRSGECALCRTRMISGNVFVPPEVIIREVDKALGFIHPCISYPISDLELDLAQT